MFTNKRKQTQTKHDYKRENPARMRKTRTRTSTIFQTVRLLKNRFTRQCEPARTTLLGREESFNSKESLRDCVCVCVSKESARLGDQNREIDLKSKTGSIIPMNVEFEMERERESLGQQKNGADLRSKTSCIIQLERMLN